MSMLPRRLSLLLRRPLADLLRGLARRVDPQPRYLSELSNTDVDVLTGRRARGGRGRGGGRGRAR